MPSSRTGTGQHRSDLQSVLGELRGTLLGIALFSFLLNLLMLTTPLYMLSVYQRVLTSGHHATLFYLTLVAIFALLVLGLLFSIRSWLLSRISTWLSARLGERVFSASLGGTLAGSPMGAQPLRDLGQLQSFISGPGVSTLFDSPWVPVFVVVIWLMHPWLGLLALGSAIVLYLLAWCNELLISAAQKATVQQQSRAYQFAESSLRNAEVVRAMHMGPSLQTHWRELNTQALEEQDIANSRSAFIVGITRFVRLAAQVGVLGLGAVLVLSAEITAGHMIAAAILLGRALAPVEQATAAWRSFVSARTSYSRLQKLLDAFPQEGEKIVLPAPQGHLDVENASYLPPGSDKPVLQNISFSVPAGTTVAVIGPSASGKTSLCRLLVGVWPPNAGAVRLDGAQVHEWNREAFSRHVGYLPQDVELFAGSVRQNIARMGEAADEEVIAAASLADVHDMILHLPQGYATEIGAGGFILSAGQRQRIGLARALFRDPRVVVLDEPNANLDRVGEAALSRTLKALKARGTTVILVVHHASLLASVDKVLLLQDGRVGGYGPRSEIIPAFKGSDHVGAESSGKSAEPGGDQGGAGAPERGS